uniref:NADH-ubiquinone oxidoreductase chain 3 n=1 Tax=Abispa ephippium TaxID=485912 RepID=B6RQY5_9HYME|nr:NADH dehydrogenase subunit 3 [Abispa ephippium]
MIIILSLSLIPIMLISILIYMNFMINFNKKKNRDKPLPFECGFNPMNLNIPPMPINFIITGMIFLIFDVEIIILTPIIATLKMSIIWYISSLIMIITLLLGLIYEWNEQNLKWST